MPCPQIVAPNSAPPQPPAPRPAPNLYNTAFKQPSVMDRVLALQLEAGLPIHVIPVRTPQRAARLIEGARQRRAHVSPSVPPGAP